MKKRDTYKASRIFYYFEVACEYLISVITSGAYLAKLTTTIGITDATTAILSMVGSLAGAFQILSIFLSHKRPIKSWVVPFRLVEQLLRAALFLLPFLSIGPKTLSGIFFAMTLVYQLLYNASAPAKTVWFMNLVDEDKRGKFVSTSQVVSLSIGMVSALVFGVLLDEFEKQENIDGAFILIAIVLLVTSIIHAVLLLLSKEKPEEAVKNKNPFNDIKSLFKNKRYVRFLILSALWCVVANVSMPFLGTYQINELGFTMTVISIVEVVFSLINITFVYLCGKLSGRVKNLSFLKFGCILYAIHFVVLAFMVPSNGLFMFLFGRLFYLVGLSAVTIGNTMLYDVVSERERTAAVAFNTITTGVLGFLVTLATTPLFNYIQIDLGSTLFGTTIYAQQVLNFASAILTVGLLVYLFVAIKDPKAENPTKTSDPLCEAIKSNKSAE